MDTQSGQADAELFLAALKASLKERGIGYREVAEEMEVSLPTVKRMLNKPGLPLDRLMELCRLAGVSFGEVASRAESARPRHQLFSEEQDELFAERPEFMSYFQRLAEVGESPLAIERRLGLSRLSTERYLQGLERVGLLDRDSGLKVKLRVKPPYGFPPGSKTLRKVQAQFMATVVEQVVSGRTEDRFSLLKPLRLSRALLGELKSELLELMDRYSFFSSRARGGGDGEAVEWRLAVALARSEAEPAPPIVELKDGWPRKGKR